ncbi:tumor necrosis factor receptor superfamily member 4 [Plectropomus leopardus]|uniref:tumor necrosis factor receptor superfamily member 4 n=1 Tax=Plectropomus leopardus TaxID=160734 RepID=UPI001C4B11F0|nr:tumor necrosis factor receptor superfamily member 4 [Plectropomus leopardus]
MVLLKVLVFTLTFNELIVDLDACPPGQRVARDRTNCEACPNGYYSAEENHTQHCKPCTKCSGKYGSDVKENCTNVTNTKCQCRGEFLPSERDSSTCKCSIGFGFSPGECKKCEDGYFNTQLNSPCRKWTECKSGVKTRGSSTSDVTCNLDSTSNLSITTTPTSSKIISIITRLTTTNTTINTAARVPTASKVQPPSVTSHHPTTTTTAARTPRVPSMGKGQPSPTPDTGTYSGPGMTLLIFGIIGLLLLTVVICKFHITPQPAEQKNDSLCRRPVEESGDSIQSPLKLNPEE